MPLTPNILRGDREPISHEVPQNTRPQPAPPSRKGVILTKAQRAKRWEQEYLDARAHLDRMDAAAAVAFLEGVGVTVLECYLVAEADGQNRTLILQQFPKPGASAREKFHAPKPRPRRRSKETPVAVAAEADGEEQP